MEICSDFRDEDFGTVKKSEEGFVPSLREDQYNKFEFTLAPVEDTFGFVQSMKSSHNPNKEKQLTEVKKGTTTLGFKFNGGVILAVDSRASMGQFNSSETVRKIIEIDDRMLGTMAGGAADCQFWEGYLGNFCRLYQLQNGERLGTRAASKVFSNIMFNHRGKI